MSRRKQARPKALKRLSQDAWEEEFINGNSSLPDERNVFEDDNTVANLGPVFTKEEHGANQAGEDEEMDVGNDVIDEDDEQEMYNCDTCGSVFADLSTFMDHRNTDCSTVIISEQNMDSEDSPMSVEGGAYQCQFCNKTFCRLSYLKRHEQIHSDKMPFRCDYCSRLFKHKRSRDRHIKLHTGDKKYQCSECNTCFARSDHLKIHIRTHGTTKQFQCTICNRVFDTLATLTSHYQTCHKYALSVGVQDIVYQETKAQKLWKCGDCNEAFPSAIEKEKHVKDEHTKVSASVLDEGTNHEGELEFKCPICPEMLFENEQALLKHQKSEHQSGYMHVYSCLHCGNEYHSLYNLREHLSSMHPDGSTTIATDVENLSHNTCIFCRITFVSSDALQAHMSSSHPSQENIQSWHPGGRFMCSQCRVSFPSDRSLKEHISQSHGTDSSSTKEQNTFNCPHCTKSYQSEEVLRTHINRTHTESLNKMRYPCPYCIKQNLFDSIEQLQLHIEVYHKSNRPSMHLCPETDCKLYFNTQEDLTNHLKNDHNLVTAGEVASTLDGANQEPASSEDAANESYYSCPSCRNEFKSESQLMVHAVNHFKVVTSEYVCRDCGKSFKKPDELQKHLFEIHAHHLYKCALCKEVFDSKVTIQVHFAVKHSNECRLYSCSQCGVVYRLEEDLFMHVRMQHVKVGQRCNVCGLIFTSTLQLQSHLSTHNLIYRCPYCNATYNEAPSLDVHMKSMHKNVLSPTVPLYGISSKSPHEPAQPPVIKSVNAPCLDSPRQLKKSPHQSSDDGEEGCFICQICDEKFPLKTLLERHHAKEHDIKSRRLTPDLQTPISSPGASSSYYDNGQGLHMLKSNANNTLLKVLKSTSQTSGIVCMFCRNAILGENDLVYHSKKHKQYIAGEEASYYCVVCMLHLTSIRNLRIHAHFHFQTSSSDDSKPQNCVMCGENFRPTNNDESPVCLKCISLDTQYPNEISRPAVGSTTTKPGQFRCCHCNVKFESEAELSQHASVHEEVKKKTYQCIKCQKTFASEGEIHAHVTSHMLAEGIYHECKLCKEVFDSPAKLQCHLIDHTFTDKNYECPKCDGKFIFAMDIQAHAIEHGIDGRDHKCDLCSQTFFFSAELMNHVASYHHFENGRLREEYRCYECGRQFISRSNLYSHMKTHTAKERVCRCPLCPEVFLNTLAMQQHYFQSHTEAELVRSKKSLKCPKCDKTFSCATTLQNHMRQHNQSKGYSCTECNKIFGLVKHLTLHMAIHSSQTPFQCPLCDKRFSKKEHRKAHFKSHCGMTQFACPHCTKLFSKKSQVQKHMLSHVTKSNKPTSTPRYKCYVCRAAFNDEPTYKQHMQRMHGVQYNQPQDDHTKDISESTTRKNSTTQLQRGTYTGVPENCCPMCNAMFPDDIALRGHMQSFHRIQFSHSDDVSCGADNGTSLTKPESEPSYLQPTPMSYQDSIQDPSSRATNVSDCQDQNDSDKGRLSDDNKGYRVYSMGLSDEKFVCPLCEDRFSTTQSMRRHLKRTHGARTSKRRKLSGKGFDENGSPRKTSRRDSSDASSDGEIVVHMAE
ncbi:zinc finger protein 423-like [Anneissia japonica]|uniref:zinc finger protein 423-like n=1 Tax=Anneissia japonica TaxID=1529436 RepID=UPI0014257489|nr:zinc finger protein 423-like [Anneissia japonica]